MTAVDSTVRSSNPYFQKNDNSANHQLISLSPVTSIFQSAIKLAAVVAAYDISGRVAVIINESDPDKSAAAVIPALTILVAAFAMAGIFSRCIKKASYTDRSAYDSKTEIFFLAGVGCLGFFMGVGQLHHSATSILDNITKENIKIKELNNASRAAYTEQINRCYSQITTFTKPRFPIGTRPLTAVAKTPVQHRTHQPSPSPSILMEIKAYFFSDTTHVTPMGVNRYIPFDYCTLDSPMPLPDVHLSCLTERFFGYIDSYRATYQPLTTLPELTYPSTAIRLADRDEVDSQIVGSFLSSGLCFCIAYMIYSYRADYYRNNAY